jgi:hypothetical protein
LKRASLSISAEPAPGDPAWPRYSPLPFPSYRFVPGLNPHPNRDPKGHNYGTPEPKPPHLPPELWKTNEMYLYGIDLYNFAYWWECHVALEGLWHAAGRKSVQAQFLQGIIQVAASNLKRHMGKPKVAADLALEGLDRLKPVHGQIYMGVEVDRFVADVRRSLDGGPVALIKLQ